MTRLTPAERKALDALGEHETVKAAAFALGKSRWTVQDQVRSARRRLGATTNVGALWRLKADASLDKTDSQP